MEKRDHDHSLHCVVSDQHLSAEVLVVGQQPHIGDQEDEGCKCNQQADERHALVVFGTLLEVAMTCSVRHKVEDLDELDEGGTTVEDPVEEVHGRHIVEEVERTIVVPERNLGDLQDQDKDLNRGKEDEDDREG